MEGLKAAAVFAAELIKAAWQGNFPCLFHALTGAYCPGCGGTRAVKSLLRGRLLLSALYHPVILYTLLGAACLLIRYAYCRKKKKPFGQRGWQAVLIAGTALLTANFLIKNYLLLCGFDLLAALDHF